MTIRELAKLAGVSTATVSKVLNNKGADIGEETRQKILALAKQHNYVPYQKVVERVSRKSNTVALLITDASNIFDSELLRGVEDFFYEHDYTVIACNTDYKAEKEEKYLDMLRRQNVRGVIRPLVPAKMDGIYEEDVATVLLDEYLSAPNSFSVSFNNRGGSHAATGYLIEQGHSRIGYITSRMVLPYQKERYGGYRQALETNGIPFDEALVFVGGEVTNRKASGYEGAKYLMAQKVTAIFCCDDHVAAGAYKAVREKGLHIPKDISIVGFDGSFFGEMLDPPLTTVKQSAYEIGQNSAKLLYAKLNNLQGQASNIQVQPQLIVRDSVCPPTRGQAHKKRTVAVVGEVRVDMRFSAGEDGTARQMQTTVGGWAVQTALLQLEKGHTVYLVGCIGNDAGGRTAFEQLAKTGLRLDGLVFGQQPTGTAVFIAEEGEADREVVYPGANALLGQAVLPEFEWIFRKAGACLLDPALDDKTAKAIAALHRGENAENEDS